MIDQMEVKAIQDAMGLVAKRRQVHGKLAGLIVLDRVMAYLCMRMRQVTWQGI